MKKILTLLLLATLLLTACNTPAPPIDNETTEPTETTVAPPINNETTEPTETTVAPTDAETTTPEDNEITTPPAISVDIPGSISEYLLFKNGQHYLILPISKRMIWVSEGFKNDLENIDVELLKNAEQNMIDAMPFSTEGPGIDIIKNQSGNLCLAASWIVDIDPPEVVTDENGETLIDKGCNIDHRHEFLYFVIERSESKDQTSQQ